MRLSTTLMKSTIGVFSISATAQRAARATKRRLSYETLELICQRGAARAAGNYQLTYELTKRCRKGEKRKRLQGER
ncbi:hypothetical protein ANCDUO_11418 [Ancylostoma duodenale]|uniref:Uncharacterized protein n=1 Tax=Ancylostoma duodenale TaxID=51022 RepID=A0A0C2D896_9BILA|nr:hypothetical protein ANCDUO_11418 [Ancylostoma duodenale]